jgi:hypothetical protein
MARSKSMKNKSRRRQRGGFRPEDNKKYVAVGILKLYHQAGEQNKLKMLTNMYDSNEYLIDPQSLEVCGDELFTEYMENLKHTKNKKRTTFVIKNEKIIYYKQRRRIHSVRPFPLRQRLAHRNSSEINLLTGSVR